MIQHMSQSLLNLPKIYCRGLPISLGIVDETDPELLAQLAIRTYLTYKAFNTARRSPTPLFSRHLSLLHYCQYARDGLALTSPARRSGAKAGRELHPSVQAMGGPPAAIRRSG